MAETTDDTKTFSGRTDILRILQQQGEITSEQADQVRRQQRRSIGKGPADVLMEMQIISEESIFRAAADANGFDFEILADQQIPEESIKAVPVKIVMHYRVMPVRVESGILTVAFSNPPTMRDRENMRLVLATRVKPVIATPSDINRAIKQYYGLGAETVMQIRQDRGLQDRIEKVVYEDEDLAEESQDNASIIHLVNQILLEALEMNATDVHIEPFEEKIQLRYRIDGMLRMIPTPNGVRELHAAITSRLKVMANLDIAEKRLPQDGRIRVRLGDEQFDLRVSIMPTRYGETLNMRILNRNTIFFDLGQLGLEKEQMSIFSQLVEMPHGIILVTGPTGSGKTTTLYAALEKTNTTVRKVITVEDPIEYQLEGISQIQIHSSIGLTFSAALRSILRHDPDIILVGEIRDSETAEIAIRAALTGHLVLSTLHTNDSIGAVNRLVDMGCENFLVASSLRAVLAQRLVRRICPHCRVIDEDVPDRILEEIAETLDLEPDDLELTKGSGCVECNQNGYRGRVAIYEFFLNSERFEDMICREAANTEIRLEAYKYGMRTLRMDGWRKAQKGLTSIDEVLRLTSTSDISY